MVKVSKSISPYQIIGVVALLFALVGFLRAEADRVTALEFKQLSHTESMALIVKRLNAIDLKLDDIRTELAFRRGRESADKTP